MKDFISSTYHCAFHIRGLGRERVRTRFPLAHHCNHRLHPRELKPSSKTTSSFPSPREASAGSSPDIPAMPVVSDPSDEIRAILIRYAKGDIGPPGAGQQIMAILRRKGHVTKKKKKRWMSASTD